MNRIVYLHGFASSPLSKKARFFGSRFGEMGIPFEVPELAEGNFKRLTISAQLGVIERACGGKSVTLMGSSLGGYLAALYAAGHSEVARVILMAPAFCFPRTFVAAFPPDQVEAWRRTGKMRVFHYGEGRECDLGYQLIEDAQKYEDNPDVRQPGLILQGTNDTVVPATLAEFFAAGHPNARLRLFNSDHELIDVLDELWSEVVDFLGIGTRAS